MGLTLSQRRAITEELAHRYQRARKKERGQMLDQITSVASYDRSYAAFLLRNWGRKKMFMLGGKRLVVIFGLPKKRHPQQRPRVYDDRVVTALERLWKLSDGLCGKRLAPFIRDTVPILEHFEELTLDAATRQKLLAISPATIDRLLAKVKVSTALKGRSTTKPGTLLKHQIPIRTFADWNEQTPGFVEIDLVQHDGGHTDGEFCQTLDVTDVCTGWTETRAVRNKAQRWVFEALQDVIAQLPFDLAGLTPITAENSSTHHCNDFVKLTRLHSPAAVRTAKMTTASSNRKTIPSSAKRSAITDTTLPKNWNSYANSTSRFGCSPTSSNR